MSSSTIYWILGIGLILLFLFSYNACSHRSYERDYYRSDYDRSDYHRYNSYGTGYRRRNRGYSSPIRSRGSSFRGRSYGGGGK
jgi:hypothetical protein